MQKLFILLISLMSIQLIAGEKSIEKENLDSYYIYYSFKKQEGIRAFTYMIEDYEPCIQPFESLNDTNHPYNITSKIFPLKLFLTENFFNNPELKLTAQEKNINDYGEHHFHFYTKTGKTIKEVIEEKVKYFEEKHFPSCIWFNPLSDNGHEFKKYVTELIEAGIVIYDKEEKKISHGPNSWVVKMQNAKLLEDKINAALNHIKTYSALDMQKTTIEYLLVLRRS